MRCKVVARFSNLLEEIKSVPVFRKLILHKLDGIALRTYLSFVTDVSQNNEGAEFRPAGCKLAHYKTDGVRKYI
jgi:hypothetical protein